MESNLISAMQGQSIRQVIKWKNVISKCFPDGNPIGKKINIVIRAFLTVPEKSTAGTHEPPKALKRLWPPWWGWPLWLV